MSATLSVKSIKHAREKHGPNELTTCDVSVDHPAIFRATLFKLIDTFQYLYPCPMPFCIATRQQFVSALPRMRTGLLAVATQDRQRTRPDLAVLVQWLTPRITSVAEPTRSMSKGS